jgi:Cu/Zn superoxide dismutase
VRRITKAALGGIAACALILGGTQAAGGVESVTTYTFAGPLRDLDTSTDDGAFDSATALVKITETADGTTYWIRVKGIDAPSDAEFGAHLHTGPCIEGNGTAAGPHYNADVASGKTGADVVVSSATEVWFELTPNENGVAVDSTEVLFVPTDFHGDQEMSIVIHAHSTDDMGVAGPRQACLPLDFSEDQQ